MLKVSGNQAPRFSSTLPKPQPSAHLTIRSSRDRFAARLTRYRVPPRRAATRPGLTQVLGLHKQDSEVFMDTSQDQSVESFFSVSTTKLVVMALCTFGLYQIYWLYQNWRIVKYREHRNISPPWHSVLGVFFLYPVFRRIQNQASRLGFKTVPVRFLFLIWVLVSLLNYSASRFLTLASFGSVFALVPVQRLANSINQLASPHVPR